MKLKNTNIFYSFLSLFHVLTTESIFYVIQEKVGNWKVEMKLENYSIKLKGTAYDLLLWRKSLINWISKVKVWVSDFKPRSNCRAKTVGKIFAFFDSCI